MSLLPTSSGSTTTLSQGPFPGFATLAPTIFYYIPNESTQAQNRSTSSPKDPNLIILSTWMGAAPKHILKYISGYQTLYPTSQILVMTNTIADIIYRSHDYHKKNLKPAVSVIRRFAESYDNPKILLHLFSNGGAHHIAHLAFLYRREFSKPLPITGMVLDSAPGRATFNRSVAAMSVGLPSTLPLRLLGLVVIYFVCMGMWFKHHVLKSENVISLVRRQLVDPSLFPRSAPRVYIYSKADDMVGWQDVESNVVLAENKGYTVDVERFERSKHVGHLLDDGETYWGAVKRVVR